jgi:hypothetical protein
MQGLKNKVMTILDVAKLNLTINFVGVVAIAALLFAARCETTSLAVMVFGSNFYFSDLGTSPHPSLGGAATMAAFFPLAIIFWGFGYLTGLRGVFFLVTGVLLFGLASLIREPIGHIGLVVSIGALAYCALRRHKNAQRLWLLILLVATFLAWQAPRWVLMARDTCFPIQPTINVQTHGMAHNLYIGLGAAGDNKFGIRWDDSDGAAAVQKVDASVPYVSGEYFKILMRAYLDRVAEDPIEVARIYSIKCAIY